MIALGVVFLALALGLIALAIWKRPFVKASVKFWSIGFSLEAKGEYQDRPKLH